MTYKHYKNGKKYTTINMCKIQENGEWIHAIIYREVGGEDLYVRSLSEFSEKFEGMGDE